MGGTVTLLGGPTRGADGRRAGVRTSGRSRCLPAKAGHQPSGLDLRWCPLTTARRDDHRYCAMRPQACRTVPSTRSGAGVVVLGAALLVGERAPSREASRGLLASACHIERRPRGRPSGRELTRMAVCSGGGSNDHARFFLRLCAGALLPRRFRGVSPVHRGRRADLDPHRRPRWCHRGNSALRERGLQSSDAAPRSWRLAAAARLLRSAVARTVEAVTTPDLGRLSCVRSLRRSVEKRAHGWNQGPGACAAKPSPGSLLGSCVVAAPARLCALRYARAEERA